MVRSQSFFGMILLFIGLFFLKPALSQGIGKEQLINSAFLGFLSIDQADSTYRLNKVKQVRMQFYNKGNLDSLWQVEFDSQSRLIRKKIWHKDLADTILLKVIYLRPKKLLYEYSFPANALQADDFIDLQDAIEDLHIGIKDIKLTCEIEEQGSQHYGLKVFINSKLCIDTNNLTMPWFKNSQSSQANYLRAAQKLSNVVTLVTEQWSDGLKYLFWDSVSNKGKSILNLVGFESEGKPTWTLKNEFSYNSIDSLVSWNSFDLVNNRRIESKIFNYNELGELKSESRMDFANVTSTINIFAKGNIIASQFCSPLNSTGAPFFTLTTYKYQQNGMLVAMETTLNNESVTNKQFEYIYW